MCQALLCGVDHAILLARAMATSMRGLRASMRASHEPGELRRPFQVTTDIAPTISNFRGPPQSLFAAAGVLARHEPEPGGEVPPASEVRHGGCEGLDRHGGHRADAGHAAQAVATALFSASSAIRASSVLMRSDRCAIWSR
jgi:hypothetical protein